MTPIFKAFLVFFISFTTLIQAQYTDVINSNRPGASQTAFSVGKKVLQFELGPFISNEKRSPYPSYKAKGFGVDFAAHYGFLKEALEVNIQGT